MKDIPWLMSEMKETRHNIEVVAILLELPEHPDFERFGNFLQQRYGEYDHPTVLWRSMAAGIVCDVIAFDRAFPYWYYSSQVFA